MKILALDPASGLCSVALRIDGVTATRELVTSRDHGRELLPMVQALLAEAGIVLSALDAIAFGRGRAAPFGKGHSGLCPNRVARLAGRVECQ